MESKRGELAEALVRRAPLGLSVELLEVGDDEYAVFQWDIDEPAPGLTAAERSILGHVAAGASNADIARARGSSSRTVANQVASLLKKLGASSRFDLIRRYGRPHAARRST
jgi:DNA-binding NarL/FixJ family response regulator